MLLVDTNIWLERLLEQEKSDSVKLFLNHIPAKHLFISDFSLHSIGVIMHKLKETSSFFLFANDLFEKGNVRIATLDYNDFGGLKKVLASKKLDFDDAYQACCIRKYDIQLVTFDSDFSKAGIHSLTPEKAIKYYEQNK